MTKFEGCFLTAEGLALCAKSGINLVFTRAEIGSGMYTDADDVRDMTALKSKEYDCTLESVDTTADTANVVFYITNMGVTEAYRLTEIGIYAKCQDGGEILYCVAYAKEEYAEMIEPETDGQITYCQKFCVATKISAESAVSVQISGTDKEWVENRIRELVGETDEEKGSLQEQLNEVVKSQEKFEKSISELFPELPVPTEVDAGKTLQINESGKAFWGEITSTNLLTSFPEFAPKTTTFNADGSITEKLYDAEGNLQATKTTTFNDDGSITEKLYDAEGNLQATKTTTFNDDGSISETVI